MSESTAPWDEPSDGEGWGTLSADRRAPLVQPPVRFAEAYAELQAIAARLRPSAGAIPDVDLLEPLVRRANELALFCQARIEAVRVLVEEERGD